MIFLRSPITSAVSTIYTVIGIVNLMLKNYPRADHFYTKALDLAPEDSLALFCKGQIRQLLEDYTQAIHYYSQAIAREFSDPKAYLFRGYCYAQLKQYNNAIEDYNKTLTIKPSLAYIVYIERGVVYFKLRQLRVGMADLALAQQLKPNRPEAYISQSAGFIKLKNYQQGIACCTQSISLKPYALAYCNRGVAYIYLKNYQEAEANYQQAIQVDPKFALTYLNLADLNFRIKNFAPTIELCNQALRLEPKSILGYSQRAIAYLFQYKITEAKADLAEAQRLDPTDLKAKGLGFWLSLGTTPPGPEAVAYLKSLVATNPNDYHAEVLQAISEGLSGRWGSCLYQLRQAWTTETEDFFNPFWVGLACAFMHQDQEALAALTYAIQRVMPGPLLNPLHWLQAARPDFYQQHIRALLKS